MMFIWGVIVKNHMQSLFNLHSVRFGENSKRKLKKKKKILDIRFGENSKLSNVKNTRD